MKLELPLYAGQRVTLEAAAGLVVMQTHQANLRPSTVLLTPERCAALIDLLGLAGVVAEEQGHELETLCTTAELLAPARNLAGAQADNGQATAELSIPAWFAAARQAPMCTQQCAEPCFTYKKNGWCPASAVHGGAHHG